MKVEKDDFDDTLVVLDTYNSDLNLVIDPARYSAHPLTSEGFAFMWAGARATYGIMEGKICFEVEVVKHIDCPHLPADEPNPHVVRVGFSVESTSMQLGEEPLSYGYGGTGKMSTNCQFKDFGEEFLESDTVMGLLNLDSDPVQIGFAKNGKFLGWAYKISKDTLKGKPLFPHVLSKNCSFEVNFGQKEKPHYQPPDGFKEYKFLECVPVERRIRGVKAPEKREDCEMIMMCGLPGAGKSTWAAEYSEKHPDKKYNVLGTNNIIDKMKVMGLPRKRNYAGRWEVLIQMATKCINKMFEIGSKLRRNYVLDQTNVYPTAQRRKMRNFEGFKRRAVIVVPTDLEFRKRINKREREEGKDVPDSAVLEMKANFKLPEVGDIFDEVIFTELQKDEAEKLVRSYNEEGRSAVGPPHKRFHGNKDHSPARPPVQPHQQAGYGTGNFRGQGVNHSGRSGPQGSFGGQGGGCSDFGGRNEFGGREQCGGQNFSGGRNEFGGGRGEFGGGRGEFGGGRGEFGGGRGEFGGGRGEFGGGRSEFGQSSFGRGEPDGRRDYGRADFEGRGMPSGNSRDCSDYGGAGGPAFNAYNRGGPFSDYKGGLGGEYPNYVDVKSGVGGRSDSGPGGYKGRQSDWFGQRPDSDHVVKSYDKKFGNSESSVGYSGPNTQTSNDRLQGGSQGNDFGRRSGYGGGRSGGLGSSGNFANRGGSQGGYSGRGGSQGGYGSRGGSQGGYSGRGGSQGGYGSRGGSQGGYGSRGGSQGGYSSRGGSPGGYGGRGGSRGGYSGPGGNQSGYDGREGAGTSSYGKDGPGAYTNASGSGYGKDNAQSSLYGKDAHLSSYGTETRSSDGYRSGENQSTFKSDSAGSHGGHTGSSSRGSYGGSGTESGFHSTRDSNYSAGSCHGGYVTDYSTSGHSFSGGQNSRGGSQSDSRNGNEKKSWSQDSSATSVSNQQAISGSQTEQSSYSNYTSPNTGSSGTGTTGVTTFGSYNDENKSHGQATQQQWKGSGSYSQNAEQTSAYNQQQTQPTPAVQTWDQTTTATGQTGAATSTTQPQAQQVWNQYYQHPQQAQYYSQYYGFPPAAQGYSGSYPAK